MVVIGFAVYDIYKRRVPDKALAFFLPITIIAPMLTMNTDVGSALAVSLFKLYLKAARGAGTGFVITLISSLLSKNGEGMGGGDIKLTTVLGLVYGPKGITRILLIASLTAFLAGLRLINKKRNDILLLPFVPFIAVGCMLNTIFDCALNKY